MGFASSFEKTFGPAASKGSDNALEAIKEKIKQDQTKAQNRLEATTINNAILMTAAQSGDQTQLEQAQTMLDAIGDTQPDASKLVYTSIQQRIKDKTDFQQAIQTESTKARMLGVNDVIKSLADRGGYSIAQLQEIGDAAYKNASLPIESRISLATPGESAQPGGTQDLINQTIPQKKTEKQQDREMMMKQGNQIIGSLRTKYNEISEKYGTGRIKGMMTIGRGGLGDILPKGEQAPEVAAYEGLLDGAAVFVGRNVWNDDRVSQDDRGTYKKALAKLTNSDAEAKLMFDALDEFSKSDDPNVQTALKLMIPHNGKGKSMLPSKALSSVGLLETAVNKKTGERLYKDKVTGKWIPLPKE